MPSFQIHRLRDHERQRFRWAPHTSGTSIVKAKDYEKIARIESPTEYGAWLALREAGTPLHVGDLLETEDGSLRICKYIGFEEARWFVPEVRQGGAANAQSLEPSEEAQAPGAGEQLSAGAQAEMV
ncbi:MAG TPA: hypothetical protein VHD76_12875 [Bryobacteraceae bacterium]|jgi:hypothetical protein|nr:hypothetical protein [Bryobacteraceae bacterium]